MSAKPATAGQSGALYIHIPFCDIRCGYCDFFTVTRKNDEIPAYIAAVKQEMDLYAHQPYWRDLTFSTLYFGGGTPSLLNPRQLAELISHATNRFAWHEDIEVTIEANPVTIDEAKLAAFRDAGVNRLSIGVQSFHEDELKFLDRDHDAAQAVAAFGHARKAGFDNISIDLIYAIPGQTPAGWRQTLAHAVALDPEHISAYCLTYEEGTPLSVQMRKGGFRPESDENERLIQTEAMNFLAAREFEQYEISNFAKSKRYSRHNQKYWDGSPYLGLGASAHSFDGRRRFWNARSLRSYIQPLQKEELPTAGHELLDDEQIAFECIYLGLRRMCGVGLTYFEHRTGASLFQRYGSVLSKLFSQDFSDPGLRNALTGGSQRRTSDWLNIEGGHLRLTREGIPLCDAICAEFI